MKTKKPRLPRTTPYYAAIKIMGKTSRAKGRTAMEAIAGLNPGRAKSMAILTLARGTATKDRILTPAQVARLFLTAGLSREVAIKQTSSLFDGI